MPAVRLTLSGYFDLGEGKYHVDWLMRDRTERVCSGNWDVEASLPAKDKQMPLDIQADAIHPFDTHPFKQEPPVERAQQDGPLNVKVVINFAPQDASFRRHATASTPARWSPFCAISPAIRALRNSP